MEKFKQDDTLDTFNEEETLGLLLDLARCPGDREATAHFLLSEFGSLKGVLEAREEQLTRVRGIGKNGVRMIRVILPMTRVWERVCMESPDHIGNSREAEAYCKSLLIGFRHEQFWVICLNAKCRVLGKRKISDGSLTEVSAYPRMVVETALNYNAYSILLAHNHPGGTNYPSGEDINSTKILQHVLGKIGILVLDHIIVAGSESYSMIQHGDIDYRKT